MARCWGLSSAQLQALDALPAEVTRQHQAEPPHQQIAPGEQHLLAFLKQRHHPIAPYQHRPKGQQQRQAGRKGEAGGVQHLLNTAQA